MKKKFKFIALMLPLLLLTACDKKIKIEGFTYAYQTSEVQDVTHDVYLAHCENDIYIEVDEDYSKGSVAVKKTGNIIYYRVYGRDDKVSNKGWEKK